MDRPFINFRNWVDESPSAQGTDCHGNPATIVLRTEDYWTADRINEIHGCNGTQPSDIPNDYIVSHYPRIWSTLVYISVSGGNCTHYFNNFYKKMLKDDDCPLLPGSDVFGCSPEAENVLRKFLKHQYLFMPAKFGDFPRHQVLHEEIRWPMEWQEDIYPETGAISTSKIKRYKVHPGSTLEVPNQTIVVKEYDLTDDDVAFQNERQAYVTLGNYQERENIRQHYLAYYGSFVQCGKGYLLLEYANEHSLDVYWRENKPLTWSWHQHCAFWKGLASLLLGLSYLHNVSERMTFRGVHQDLKPTNIFIVRTESGDLQFKLGDLGMCSTQLSRHRSPTHPDSQSTKMYGAPETAKLNESHEGLDNGVTAAVDIWSVGCVFAEAVIWSLKGDEWLQSFLGSRKTETGCIQALHGMGYMGAFHDGARRLNCVDEFLRQATEENGLHHNVLGRVTRIILDRMLHHRAGERGEAGDLFRELDKLLPKPDQETALLAQTHSSPPQVHNSHSQPPHSESIDQADTTFSTQSSAPGSYFSVPAANGPNMPLPTQAAGPRPDRRQFHQYPPCYQLSPPATTALSANHSSRSPSPIGDDASKPRIMSAPPESLQGPLSSPVTHDPHQRLSMPPVPVHQTGQSLSYHSNINPESYNGTPQPSPSVNRQVHRYSGVRRNHSGASRGCQSKRRKHSVNRGIPWISIAEVHLWINEKKSRRMQTSHLPYYDHVTKLLNGREQIFIVDDSPTMRNPQRWGQVVRAFSVLSYLVKRFDKNGLDLYVTSQPTRRHNAPAGATRDLVRFLEFLPVTSRDPSEPQSAEYGFSEILGQIEKDKLKRRFLSSLLPKTRPRLNIYILTDGQWGGRDADCPLRHPLGWFVNSVRNEHKLQRTDVAIQFIRFGSDPDAKQQLGYLDNELGKEHDFDIVDHRKADTNVWYMLIGALQRDIDQVEDDSSDEDSTVPDFSGTPDSPASDHDRQSKLYG